MHYWERGNKAQSLVLESNIRIYADTTRLGRHGTGHFDKPWAENVCHGYPLQKRHHTKKRSPRSPAGCPCVDILCRSKRVLCLPSPWGARFSGHSRRRLQPDDADRALSKALLQRSKHKYDAKFWHTTCSQKRRQAVLNSYTLCQYPEDMRIGLCRSGWGIPYSSSALCGYSSPPSRSKQPNGRVCLRHPKVKAEYAGLDSFARWYKNNYGEY